MRKLLLLVACGIGLVTVACEPYSIEAGQRCCSYIETISEDDPRWDCKTMGNRICGSPTVRVGATVICFVEPDYDDPKGYDVVGYTNIDSYEVGPGTKGYIGFHVPCPQGFGGGS